MRLRFALVPLLLFPLVAAAGAASSHPPGPGPGGPGPHGPPHPPSVDQLVDWRGDEIGLPQETIDAIDAIADEVAPELDRLAEANRAAHEALFAAVDADAPSEAAVLAASRAVGDADQALRDAHLSADLRMRALLTAEQWDALKPPHPPRPPMDRGPGACPPGEDR